MTRSETITNIKDLEDLDLDFDYQIPCEHDSHGAHGPDEPAMFYIHVKPCLTCRRPTCNGFICLPCWEELGRGCMCSYCLTHCNRNDRMTILRVIGTR